MRFRRTSTPDIVDADLLSVVKDHLRITGDWADTEIERIAKRAIDHIQERSRKQLLTATFEMKFDAFPAGGCWQLPRPPLLSVETIAFTDSGGSQTWASTEYDVITETEPGMVRLAYEKTLPDEARDIVVSYTAGYGTDWDSLTDVAKDAILLLTHHMYYNRDGSPPMKAIEDSIMLLTTGDEFVTYVT